MVGQVQTVAILMIVNGSLVSLMGLLYIVLGPAMFALMRMVPKSPQPTSTPDTMIMTIVSVYYVAMGIAVLTVGILNVIAGVRCLNFRGRVFALVALFGNVLPMFTCYCLPTCLGMMIYGLIVFFQADVAYAFTAVKAGAPPERFKRPRRFDEEDFGPEEEQDEFAPRPPSRRSDHVQLEPGEEIGRPPQEE
jgi:hypothetical protein